MKLLSDWFGSQGRPGESGAFRSLLKSSRKELKSLAAANQRSWGLGQEDRWNFSLDTGELVFHFPKSSVRTTAQIIGSFDRRGEIWTWSWANPAIHDRLTRHAVRLRDYGREHDIHRLVTPTFEATEGDGWDMAALAIRLCDAKGAYKGPVEASFLFITFDEVQIRE